MKFNYETSSLGILYEIKDILIGPTCNFGYTCFVFLFISLIGLNVFLLFLCFEE